MKQHMGPIRSATVEFRILPFVMAPQHKSMYKDMNIHTLPSFGGRDMDGDKRFSEVFDNIVCVEIGGKVEVHVYSVNEKRRSVAKETRPQGKLASKSYGLRCISIASMVKGIPRSPCRRPCHC